jgi:hypothetical protein
VGGVPSAWGSIASNQACLPDGIILAAQGHATVNGEFALSSNSSGSASVGLGVATGTGGSSGTSSDTSTGVVTGQPSSTAPSAVTPVAPGPASAGGAGGSSPQPMSHSSGCAYGGSDAGQSSLWLALALTGLVARLARRHCGAR